MIYAARLGAANTIAGNRPTLAAANIIKLRKERNERNNAILCGVPSASKNQLLAKIDLLIHPFQISHLAIIHLAMKHLAMNHLKNNHLAQSNYAQTNHLAENHQRSKNHQRGKNE